MKIQCDSCEKALATVICCADEAALCAKCDVEIHAANKLASKHKRLLLDCLSNKLPLCDICQEKPAFIFCVEDRALLCRDCDEPIHAANNRACNHQRFLATGIRVALSSNNSKETQQESLEIPKKEKSPVSMKRTTPETTVFTSPSWAVDDFLRFDDFDSNNKKEDLGFGELEWLNEIELFGHQEPLDAGEVPQLPTIPLCDSTISKPSKYNSSVKKPRFEIPDDEFFTVPDLG